MKCLWEEKGLEKETSVVVELHAGSGAGLETLFFWATSDHIWELLSAEDQSQSSCL